MDMFDDKHSINHMLDKDLSNYRVSKMGYKFNINDNTWKLDNSYTLNWDLYSDLKIDRVLINGCRKVLATFSSEMSANYVRNIFHYFKALFNSSGSTQLTVATIQNYLATLDKENEYKLGYIRAFLLDWHSKGIDGVTSDVANFLSSIKLRGNSKGKAVLKSCPHSGNYTSNEQQAILEWSVNAFLQDDINLEEYTWLMLSFYLGWRPIEFRSLTIGDLIVESDGQAGSYFLMRPDAKRRGAGFREELSKTDIDEELALLIMNQSKVSMDYFKNRFGLQQTESYKNNIPLFIDRLSLENITSVENLKETHKETPDYGFINAKYAYFLMDSISYKCQAKTYRLNGEFIHITSRRFRYTIATNARKRGLSMFHIAKILGHKDIQHVRVYTENTSENLDLIDEAMTEVLAPLAQAFAGTLINDERDAIRANDPRSRIKSTTGAGVGSCGEYGFCASGGRQCYLCSKFQPWVHGQHEKVLESVLEERDNLRKKGASQFVIQATDRVVLAITEVIQLCKKAKNEVSAK